MITEPQPVIEQLTEGTPLGRYVIRTWVRDGGMSSVYRGHHVETQAPVAVKVMTQAASKDPTARARFSRETTLLGRLAGVAHVAMVHDVGELPDGRRFLVMEWIDGEDLCDVLTRLRDHGRRMSPLRACRIARDVARALVVAHARGIVHRDIKPANIMLDGSGPIEVAKLLDFGISADLEPRARAKNLTQGAIVGTDIYMSPEQSLGHGPTPAMDVWALGAVLLEMLRGSRPGLELRHGAFPPFPQPAPFPADTLPLAQACVSVDPQHRPDADALLQRLERLVSLLEQEALDARPFEPTSASFVAPPLPEPPPAPELIAAPSPPELGLDVRRAMVTSGMIECRREPEQHGPSPTQLESPRPPRRWEWPIETDAVERTPRGVTVPTPIAGPAYVGVSSSMTTGMTMAMTGMMAAPTPPTGVTSAPWGGAGLAHPPPWGGSPEATRSVSSTPSVIVSDPVDSASVETSRAGLGRWVGLSLAFVGLGLGLAGAAVWAQRSLNDDVGPLTASASPPSSASASASASVDAAARERDAEAHERDAAAQERDAVPSDGDPTNAAAAAVIPAPTAMPSKRPVIEPEDTTRSQAKPSRASDRPDRASSRPVATNRQTPKPPRKVAATTPAKPAPAVDCAAARERAEGAHRQRKWSAVLSETTQRACWSSDPTERVLLRVSALIELGRFQSCVNEGGDHPDDRIKKRVQICRDRVEPPSTG